MDNKELDIAYFIAFCIERYKSIHGLNGKEAMRLLNGFGIPEYLKDCYEVLHSQSPQWIMHEIEEFISNRQNAPQP
jgi:hypothetical protein